jgi:PAS domain S-box-containing protein
LKKPLKPINEKQRLDRLRSYLVLDTDPESIFDSITKLAASLSDSSIALVSLIDQERQWFKSAWGIEARETPRDISFCGHAILADEPFIIEDASCDSRFCDNPLVSEGPQIRFYTGIPLVTPDQFKLGTLCVIDSQPKNLSPLQIEQLKQLANLVIEHLELRKTTLQSARLAQSLDDIQELTTSGTYEIDVETHETQWSKGIYDIFGIPYGTPTEKLARIDFFAGHEQERLIQYINLAMEQGQSFDDTFEFYDSQKNRKWLRVQARPLQSEDGKVRKVIGTLQDITYQREKEEQLNLVISNITEGYFDWNIPNDIFYMSPKFWEILGYDPKEKTHHPNEWKKILHPDDLKLAQTTIDNHKKFKDKKPFSIDVRYLNQKGQYKWIRWEGRIIEWDEKNRPLRMIGTHQDIHQQRIIDHKNSLFLKGLHAYAIVVETDLQGTITSSNELFSITSKYPKEEIIGQNHRLVNSGHHPKAFFEQLWKRILSGNIWKGEIKNRAKDGQYYWVDTTIIPKTDESGVINGFISFRYDITSRKMAEAELIESRNTLHEYFEQSKDPIMNLTPPDWKFTYFNKAAIELFGITEKHDSTNIGPWDVSPEYQDNGQLSADLVPTMIKTCLEKGSHFFEWTHLSLDKKRLECTVQLSRIEHNNEVSIQAIVRDITQDKALRNEIKNIKNKLELALDGAELGIWDWDISNNSIWIDKRWASMLGLDHSTFKMTIGLWHSLIHPDDLKQFNNKLNDYIEGRTDNFESIHRMQHKQGQWIYVLAKGKISKRDNQGKVIQFTGTHLDITEISLNRKQLEKTNQQLDLAIESANLGFWDWDLVTNHVYFSEQWAKQKGVTINDLTMSLTDWESRVHPEDLQMAYQKIEDYVQKKKSQYESLYRSRHENGKWIYILSRGKFTDWDSEGNPTKFTGTDLDLTELMDHKNALEDLNQKLDAIFNFSPVIVYQCLLNENWTMNFINSYVEEVTGYTAEELVDDKVTSFANLIHPDDRVFTTQKVYDAIRNQKSFDIEYRKIINKLGQTRWVWERGVSNAPDSLIGVIIEITEKKRQQEVSQLISHARTKFVEISHDRQALFDYLIERVIDLTQSQYGVFYVIDKDSLTAPHITDVSLSEGITLEASDKNRLESIFDEVMLYKNLILSNDRQRQFLGVPIFSNNDIVAVAIMVGERSTFSQSEYFIAQPFFDVCGEMIYQQEMKLELEIQKRMNLHKAKLASLGELAAGVGHEINNPLAIIMGQMELIKRDMGKNAPHDEKTVSRLEKASTAINRISAIVKGLRNFSRLDESQIEVFDISKLTHDTIEMIQELYRGESISFEVSIENDLCVLGNKGRLQQLIVNLLNNAKDAIKHSIQKRISLQLNQSKGEVHLLVEDSGPGISVELADKIFDPFFTTKDVNEGTGIGLSLSLSIAAEAQGSLYLQNPGESGARFLLVIPAQSKPQSSHLKTEILEPVIKKLTILLVEDELLVGDVLEDLLMEDGHTIIRANDGIEALRALHEHGERIDLVVTDLKMPNMNGLELIKALRHEHSFTKKIIIMSAGINTDLTEVDSLYDAFLAKPFDIALLRSFFVQHFKD